MRGLIWLGTLALAWGASPVWAVPSPSPSPSPSASLPIRGVSADTRPQPSGATHVERPPLRGGRR